MERAIPHEPGPAAQPDVDDAGSRSDEDTHR
jgi:hypothetical protein